MWATCNVGASKPEDSGLLFQFGRVDGYKYGDENHQFRTYEQNTQDTGNELIPKTASGKAYDKATQLNLEDDAAHINMGGVWMMPTKEDFKELLNNTSHEVTTINDVQGMMFTSNKNDKQLFMPFAGYWYEEDGGFMDAGSYARVWSSQVYPSNVDIAYKLNCYSSGIAGISYHNRSNAFSVRGVFQV